MVSEEFDPNFKPGVGIQAGRALWKEKARHETGRPKKMSKSERLRGFHSKYFAGGRVSHRQVLQGVKMELVKFI